MRGVLTAFRKELLELLLSVRGIVLVLVLPPLFLFLLGQLRTERLVFRVLVAGHAEDMEEEESARVDELLLLLREISVVEVETQPRAASDPLAALNGGGFDLLLNGGEPSARRWALYTAEIEPVRLAGVRQLAARFTSFISSSSSSAPVTSSPDPPPEVAPPPPPEELAPRSEPVASSDRSSSIRGYVVDASGGVLPGAEITLGGFTEETQFTEGDGSFAFDSVFSTNYFLTVEFPGFDTFYSTLTLAPGESLVLPAITLEIDVPAPNQGKPIVFEELTELVSRPTANLKRYYRSAAATGRRVPAVVSLIFCFLPFALAAPSIARERSAHTFEAYLASPGVTPRALFAGKPLRRCGHLLRAPRDARHVAVRVWDIREVGLRVDTFVCATGFARVDVPWALPVLVRDANLSRVVDLGRILFGDLDVQRISVSHCRGGLERRPPRVARHPAHVRTSRDDGVDAGYSAPFERLDVVRSAVCTSTRLRRTRGSQFHGGRAPHLNQATKARL